MNPNLKSNEILQSSPDEKITINSIEDLEKKLNTKNLPDSLKSYFSEPIQTTRWDLEELRKKYMTEKPDLKTIKAFLEKSRNSILEKSKLKLNQVKKVTWNIKESMKFEAKKIAEWKEKWKEADSLINNAFEKPKKVIDKLWNSETAKKAKKTVTQAAKKAKETTKKGVEAVKKSKWFINFIDWLEKLKKEWWLLGFFATIALFILWIFGFTKEKLKKKAEEKTNEVLKWKEAEKVKKEVVERIKTDILKIDKLQDPIIKAELEKIINDPNIISETNLIKLQKKLKENWKLTLLDLKYILWEKKFRQLQKEIFSPEMRTYLKAKAEKTIVDKIYKTYNLDLNKEKRVQLEKLVWKYINVDNFFELENKLKTKGVNLADVLWATFSQWWDIALFMIEAVWKWIIGPWKLMIYASKKWAETVSLWLAWLWVKSDISFDKFREEVQNMNSIERWLLLWTLYRHTWFLSTILWEIAWTSSRLLIEWMSSTPVSSFKAGLAWLWSDISRKNEIFSKLESIFWKSAWEEVIKDSLAQIKTLKTNNEIIRLLNQSNNNVDTFKKLLSWLNTNEYDKNIIEIIKDLDNSDFTKFREKISEKVINLKNIWISKNIKNKLSQLHFPIEKFEYEFYQNTDNILKYQREAIKSWTLSKAWKFLTKLWEIQWYSHLSRDLEKLHFENLSKEQALTKMQALKKLFLDFPELSRSFFWAIPEIGFFWLALAWKKEDESFYDTMFDTLLYMTPIIGPVKMILSSKVSLNEKWFQWYNLAEWWAGIALLWIDASYVWKTILSWWNWTEKFLKIWSHILKPVTWTFKFWIDSYKMWKNLYDVVKAEWKINWWKLWEKSLEAIKKLLNIKNKYLIAIWILSIWWYIWHEIFKDDISDDYKELLDKWIIDKQWNIKDYEKLKEEYDKMDSKEKESIIEIIFLMASVPTSWLEFKISWNNLNIISHNKTIQSDWILKDPEWKILKALDIIWFSADTINFKYEKPE